MRCTTNCSTTRMNRPNRYRPSERVPTRPVDDARGNLCWSTSRHATGRVTDATPSTWRPDLAEAGEPVLFVSTQLVEAGVDVSFDEVIRDFAPMDSLVQAAGRCKPVIRPQPWARDGLAAARAAAELRDNARKRGLRSRRESHQIDWRALATVYDGDPMPEPDVTRNAVEHYFDLLDGRDVGADEYVEYLERAEAEELGRLSLIDERLAVDVIVTRTADERETVEEIRRAFGEYRWDDLDDLVESTADWQVSVPAYPGDDDTMEKLAACEPLFPTPTDWCSTGARDGMTATSTPPTASSSLTRAWRHVYCERSCLGWWPQHRGDAVDNPFRVTGVMMQYYYVCERELWFESRNVEIDRENASVARGTRVDESSYGERSQENLRLGMIALDLLEDGRVVEVKPSSTLTEPARMQPRTTSGTSTGY